MTTPKQQEPGQDTRPIFARLEHLSGPSLGTDTLLRGERAAIGVGPDRLLDIKDSGRHGGGKAADNRIARLKRSGGTYRLEALAGGPIWVNGRQVDSGELMDNDIIEFGEKGPLSRFRLIDCSAHPRRYFSQICEDCWDYLRISRKPVPSRVAYAMGEGMRRIARDTTLLFRAGVVATLMLLGFVTYQQYEINAMQQERLAVGQRQMDNFAQTLTQTRRESLTPSDLAQLRDTLSRDLSTSLGRLEALERKSRATETVIGNSTPSVVFLQGAYGFREAASGRVLRHVLGPDGRPLVGPTGNPFLSLDGNGPPAERNFTGTGFAVGEGSMLATNHHVAQPWLSDDSSAGAADGGLEPFMIKLVAYSPGSADAKAVELIQASDDGDLALLRLAPGEAPLAPLPIATEPAANGGAVIVMGYPTGLRSMLARSGTAFVEELQRRNEAGFWQVARRLAENGFIEPLSSLGIVAQLTPEYLVYDAATTRGGSGGPVLNSRGQVVAVNTAILPDFGGSNFGVPARKLRALIAAAKTRRNARLDR